jgi:hypothetical protein
MKYVFTWGSSDSKYCLDLYAPSQMTIVNCLVFNGDGSGSIEGLVATCCGVSFRRRGPGTIIIFAILPCLILVCIIVAFNVGISSP